MKVINGPSELSILQECLQRKKIKVGDKVMFKHNESVTVLVDNLGINLWKLLGKASEQIKKNET